MGGQVDNQNSGNVWENEVIWPQECDLKKGAHGHGCENHHLCGRGSQTCAGGFEADFGY